MIFRTGSERERGTVVEHVHAGKADEDVLVDRQVFKVSTQQPLVHVGGLVGARINHTVVDDGIATVRQEVAVRTREVEQLNAAETGKDAFRAEFTGVAAKVMAELEVHTLQVTLVAFDHGIAYRHVAAPGENQRLVKESIDTRRGEQGQGAVLLAEVTDHPVEVLSDIALDIQPCDRDALRGIREVVLHARLEAENHVETGRVVGAEMEVQVSRHELGALDIGHLVNFGLLLVGRHVGVDEQALNASAYFQAALCFKGILLRFQQLVHLVIRLCGRDRSSDKER